MNSIAYCPYCFKATYIVDVHEYTHYERYLIRCENLKCKKHFSVFIEFNPIFNEVTLEEHYDELIRDVKEKIIRFDDFRIGISAEEKERQLQSLNKELNEYQLEYKEMLSKQVGND